MVSEGGEIVNKRKEGIVRGRGEERLLAEGSIEGGGGARIVLEGSDGRGFKRRSWLQRKVSSRGGVRRSVLQRERGEGGEERFVTEGAIEVRGEEIVKGEGYRGEGREVSKGQRDCHRGKYRGGVRLVTEGGIEGGGVRRDCHNGASDGELKKRLLTEDGTRGEWGEERLVTEGSIEGAEMASRGWYRGGVREIGT
ncbi:hypothetical protein RRG08_004446 [Elysia crispata]|uniref:Uncharacterized protein n=1 Tax=Elysia crispata TaxID=231223 RepID=A0AAE1E6E7_9GAST|nr:hypothetical protein RRG08_004446 [Elysia crispata]